MFKNLLAAIFRLLVGLRYRISIKGLERIPDRGGLLVLPNHPAEIDPLIVTVILWPRARLRPIVLERFYNTPLVHAVMRLVKAIPMPDMEGEIGHYKRRRVDQAINSASDTLASGGNILLYPSGRLMRGGLERLRAASGAATLMKRCPQAVPVLVRTRGLYGSSFSCFFTPQRSPDFLPLVKSALITILKNFIFFVPKRRVEMEVYVPGKELPSPDNVLELNRFLEEWFNAPGEEKPALVSRSFWREDIPALPEMIQGDSVELTVPKEVEEKVLAKLSEVTGEPRQQLGPQRRLSEDLGLDSLEAAEFLMWLDEEFASTGVEIQDLVTIGDLLRAAAGGLGTRVPEAPQEAPPGWNETGSRPGTGLEMGETLAECFVRSAIRRRSSVCLADDAVGVLTYSKTLKTALALASFFERLPGERIGVMLPASGSATLVVLACMLCRKIPVLLNWTAGRKSIEYAVRVCELASVVTAAAFLDRIEADLSFLDDKLVLLEEARKSLRFRDKLEAALFSLLGSGPILRRVKGAASKRGDTAVILFTSGSEAEPKGVPLSHGNILSNIEGVIEALELSGESRQALFGFLPPFHSFGLTVCSFLPILCGIKVAYYPNPNDSRRLAPACRRWSATIVAGTPTFLRNILRAGVTADFSTVEYFVAGAERAPKELFESVAQLAPRAKIIEGYGITECSPVICANRPREPHLGVGRPIPGVDILIVDRDKHVPLPEGVQGLILVAGPNVFHGYLTPAPDPFLEVGGRRWYNTGDLGYLENGALHISGRLKRFVKIAGEMVSLPAIEEALTARLPGEPGETQIAVIPVENQEAKRPELVAFSNAQLSRDELNDVLRRAGFPNIARIARLEQLKEMPLLGSGKVDYRTLSSLAVKGS